MRWLAVVIGAALIAVAFVAGGRVADTREGLIAEVITLFTALVGVGLILYAWVAGARPQPLEIVDDQSAIVRTSAPHLNCAINFAGSQ